MRKCNRPLMIASELAEDVVGLVGEALRADVSEDDLRPALRDAIEKAREALERSSKKAAEETTAPGGE